VGDNVGDIAGMGSDLFGSLAESTCAALVVRSPCRNPRALSATAQPLCCTFARMWGVTSACFSPRALQGTEDIWRMYKARSDACVAGAGRGAGVIGVVPGR